MDQEEEQFIRHLGDGFPKVFHTTGHNLYARWMFLSFIPIAIFIFIDGISSGEFTTPREILSLVGLSILVAGFGWVLFSMWGPGEIRMDEEGIVFSRRRHSRSTPWSNVRDIRPTSSGIELEMEFVRNPFRWYESIQWMNMFVILLRNCILLGRKEWSEGSRNTMIVIGKKMTSLYEDVELSPED